MLQTKIQNSTNLNLTILILFFICLKVGLQAQNPIKWGKVSEPEKQMTHCSYDSSAVAVVISDVGHLSFEYGQTYAELERHVRIKILKEEGIDYADVAIPFYGFEGLERVEKIRAQTINFGPDGSEEVTKLDKEGIFKVEKNERWSEVRMALPKVKVGSIIEYKFNYMTKNIVFLEAWSFQREIPTLYSALDAEIPQGLDYRVRLKGYRVIQKYANVSGNEWVLTNLPPLKKEPFVFNLEDYSEEVSFQLASYYSRDSQGTVDRVSYLNTWDDLTKELVQDITYRNYFNRTGVLNEVLESLDAEVSDTDPQEKLDKIYGFVQHNFEWNEQFGILPKPAIKELFQLKQGNAVSLNLLLISLLRESGIEAYPVLISTRGHGRIVKSYPLLTQFNHVVSQVILGQDTLIMDVASGLPAKILPLWDRVDEGFSLHKKGAEWTPIVRADDLAMLKIAHSGAIEEDGSVKIKSQVFHEDYFGVEAVELDATELPEEIEKITGYANVELLDHQMEPASNLVKQQLEMTAKAEVINDQFIAFQPIFLHGFQRNPYRQAVRYLPVENSFKRRIVGQATYNYPADFKVESLPEAANYSLPGGKVRFKYAAMLNGKSIVVSFSLRLSYDTIAPEHYSALKQFYDLVIDKLNEKILLKKN